MSDTWPPHPPAPTLPPPPPPPPPVGWPPAPPPPPPPAWPPRSADPWPSQPVRPSRPPRPPRRPIEVQEVLLGLGTVLVAVAITVFVAVNWRRIDAVGQGLVLLAITGALAVGTVRALRRGLRATAEACGLVTVLLGLADVHALRVGLAPAAPAQAFWAGGLAIVAAAAWRLGPRTSAAASTVLAPTAIILVAAAAGVSDGGVRAVALGVASVAIVVLPRTRSGGSLARRVGGGFAASVAVLATVGAAAQILEAWAGGIFDDLDPGRGVTSPPSMSLAASVAGQFVLAALVAGVTAVVHRHRDWLRESALPVASVLGVWSSAVLGSRWGAGTAFAAAAVTSAVGFAAARFAPEPWRFGPAAATGTTFSLASVPLLAVISGSLVAASDVVARAWSISGDAVAADLGPNVAAGPSEIAAHVAALGIVAFAWSATRTHRPSASDAAPGARRRSLGAAALAALATVVAATVVVAPVATAITVSAMAYVALAASVAVLALAAAAPSAVLRRAGASMGAAGSMWALAWAAATPSLTIQVLTATAVAAGLVALRGRFRGDEVVAGGAVAWLGVGVPATVGLVLGTSAVEPAWCWAAGGVAAVVVGLVVVLLADPDGAASGIDATIARTVEVVGGVVHVVVLVGLVGFEELAPIASLLAAGSIGLGLHAVRPDRRQLSVVAALEGLGALWIVLHLRHVAIVEAYTLPVAVLLAALGFVVGRTRPVGPAPSWLVLGPALVVGLAPTVGLALTQGGQVRPLVGIVAGALLAVVGAATGRRAPFDVGVASVVALGVQQSAPVVGHLPNWATIGTTGLALLAVGATFEERRRDLRVARRRYGSLT